MTKPTNPDLRHGQENPNMAASNKQPAGSRPGPEAPPRENAPAKGASGSASGGKIVKGEALPTGPANKNVLH